MGTKYSFVCSKCGYYAEVSGGKDGGFISVVRTMVCNKCKELVDVSVGIGGREFKNLTDFKNFMKNLELSLTDNDIKFFRKCPKCFNDKLKLWNSKKRPCPRCGNKMEKGDAIIEWD